MRHNSGTGKPFTRITRENSGLTDEEWNSPLEQARRQGRWAARSARRDFDKSRAKARGMTYEGWIAYKASLKEAREKSPTDRALYQRARLKLESVKQWTKEANLRARAKKKSLIDSFKQGPCHDCGDRFHSEAMEFDHARGEKSFSIATLGRCVGIDLLKQEIAKCDLVCANCHRARTARRREGLSATPPEPEYVI